LVATPMNELRPTNLFRGENHYRFRMLQRQHSDAKPVILQGPGAGKQAWFMPYYDKNNVKFTARTLFSHWRRQGEGSVGQGAAEGVSTHRAQKLARIAAPAAALPAIGLGSESLFESLGYRGRMSLDGFLACGFHHHPR
jgi:hypothetical protein